MADRFKLAPQTLQEISGISHNRASIQSTPAQVDEVSSRIVRVFSFLVMEWEVEWINIDSNLLSWGWVGVWPSYPLSCPVVQMMACQLRFNWIGESETQWVLVMCRRWESAGACVCTFCSCHCQCLSHYCKFVDEGDDDDGLNRDLSITICDGTPAIVNQQPIYN